MEMRFLMNSNMNATGDRGFTVAMSLESRKGLLLRGMVLTTSLIIALFSFLSEAQARDIQYQGGEAFVYVKPGEPTQVTFPGDIKGGFKRKDSALTLERQSNFLVLFAQPDLEIEGEVLLIILEDERSYSLRILPTGDENPRDESVRIDDLREGYYGSEGAAAPQDTDPRFISRGFPDPSTVPGLMREMILLAEFGKQKPVKGYQRSNRYTGETVLSDGTMLVKIDEIFMGSSYWGYVLDVENLLDTNQKINPASFRLDGTRAVSAERWELSGRPVTAEQKIAGGHNAKVYVITKASRR